MVSLLKILDTRLVFLILFFCYVLFPTSNSSFDAFAYAGYVKYQDFLFTPHHLLYNPLVYTVNLIVKFCGLKVDVLFLGKMINGMFQCFNLIVFYRILLLLRIKNDIAIHNIVSFQL